MRMQRYVLFLSLVATVIATQLVLAAPKEPEVAPGPPVLHSGEVPIGSLGHPPGDYVTIEGFRYAGPKAGSSILSMDTVNGRKLSKPMEIWIDNLALPEGRRCKIKGYETVRMIGKAPARCDVDEEAGRPVVVPQTRWQVELYFVALRCIEPADLKIRDQP